MPGRHGKQVKKRNRSKRQPVTEMETTLKDSIHGRTRKERQILKTLIPPKVVQVARKVTLSDSSPMFSALPQRAESTPVTHAPPQSSTTLAKKEKHSAPKVAKANNTKKTIKKH